MILSAYEMDQRIARQQRERERAAKAAALTPSTQPPRGAMDSAGDGEDQARRPGGGSSTRPSRTRRTFPRWRTLTWASSTARR